ncbi:MAG: hypothetical protein EOP61_02110 [Sphingomonadales bacterium]|nr:MAG: hypothetical protein EOP61_02110 [Sphingomonadales bacterium]
MEELAAIAREVDLLETVQSQLAAVSNRDDEQRRHDLIELRRALSAQIAAVGKVADPVFTAKGDDETLRIYRAKFSRMRSAAALHQADWPAILLGERPEEYRASALGVREANRDFVAWVRTALKTLQG